MTAGTTHAERVRAWRRELDAAPGLSDRYRARYAVVLAQLEGNATAERIELVRAGLRELGPCHAAPILAGIPTAAPEKRPGQEPPRVRGTGPVVDVVRALVVRHPDITGFVAAQPRLEQTAVPLHPSRDAHAIRTGADGLVALRWTADSVAPRADYAARMTQLLAKVSAPLVLVTHQEYAVVEVGGEDPWVFAPHLGQTLEDQLRGDALGEDERARLVASLRALRASMIEHGLIWQGFAPRNMFFRGRQIVLIDFEEVCDVRTERARAVECLRWHRVFFADCLTGAESAQLFADAEPHLPDEHPMAADDFERALLGVETVTWRQRRTLLAASAHLEGRHLRPNGQILFGHELGHYWGDFLLAADEARLFRYLREITDAVLLVACLEILEAAMEADICQGIRYRSCGLPQAGSPRTIAVIDTLDEVGPDRLAALRHGAGDWYDRLENDPGRLVDELVHTACAEPESLDRALLDTYLVGNAEVRKTHEESLAAATGIGLDFLHRADEPFLRYREPADLQATVATPLPTEGVDLEGVLAEVDTVVARYGISQSHRHYLAFPDSGNAVAALAGGILGKLLNQNMIALDRSAPSATFVEIQVTEWLRELVGYQSAPLTELRGVRDVAGLWATGGHLSNHLAMLVALGRRFPGVRKHGLVGLNTQPAVVMAGSIAHYSHGDAAFHLGLGWDSVLNVGADSDFTTDPGAVDAVLTDPPAGKTPFMVVGVAGNCRTTGLDDLAALAEVCRRHGVWFHVDACHGGSLLFSERLRARHLRGIQDADSVSLDPHKGLFTPYPSSYVVFRERGVLTQFSRHEALVMADDCWDLGLITPFLGSRGFESLATWMLLRHVGVRRLGQLVESRQAHVRYLERRIAETGLFVRLNDVDFYRLAFVLCPPQATSLIRNLEEEGRQRATATISRYTAQLNTALYRAGAVCFDEHTLADLADRVGAGAGVSYTIMAACPGNPLLTRADLDHALDRLVRAARPLVGPMLAKLTAGTGDDTPHTGGGPAGWNDTP